MYTAVPTARWAEAVAVRGERIVAVGAAEDVEKLIEPGTRVLDLPGRMVCPGFQDSHIHPDGGGLDRKRLLLELEGVSFARDGHIHMGPASTPTQLFPGAWT